MRLSIHPIDSAIVVLYLVLPGVLAYVLFRDKFGDNPNQALPVLIAELIPAGLRGLIVAALMSTVAGALNSAATLISIDVVQKLRPDISDRRFVLTGRVTACLVIVAAIAWSTQGGHFESIFKGLNAMIACLAPPITAVFVWGVFWRRGTQQAALATLAAGFALGAVTFALDFPPTGRMALSLAQLLIPSAGSAGSEGIRLVTDGLGIPFMLQAWWLFVICSLIFLAVGLVTPPPRPDQIEGLCWKNPWAALLEGRFEGVTDPRLLAAVLAATMAALYWIFS